MWVLGTEPRSTRAVNVLKGWVISLAPKDQFYLEFPLIVLGYVSGGGYFFIQKQIKPALRIKAIRIQTICKCCYQKNHTGAGEAARLKKHLLLPKGTEFHPGPNTNVLELRDLTLSSGKERKWERGKRGRKGKEKVKEEENGEVKWKQTFLENWALLKPIKPTGRNRCGEYP